MTLASASPTLYRRLAADYSLAMELGTLKAGERMPSVRELMRRHEVSLSTALQTLRHLEDLGQLEARPRVGYFVRDARPAGLEIGRAHVWNSSHSQISYAVFCLKKKKKTD